jgi:hypothetical protein
MRWTWRVPPASDLGLASCGQARRTLGVTLTSETGEIEVRLRGCPGGVTVWEIESEGLPLDRVTPATGCREAAGFDAGLGLWIR